MITTDMHVHSSFSSDSNEDPRNIIDTAIQKGYSYVYFTDHHDIDFPVHPSEPNLDFQLNFEQYITTLSSLKEEYQNRIEVRIGVEMGICPDTVKKLAPLTQKYPFDFIIASSHITSFSKGDPYYPEYYTSKNYVQDYREYFLSELENVRLTSSFDVYGHLDYALRYCPDPTFPYQFQDYADIFEDLLKHLIEQGKGIEINTSGITKIGHPHPHLEILKLYKKLGGEIITIGSDAHNKNNIGFHFDTAENLLKECGFSYYTVFQKRKPLFIPL